MASSSPRSSPSPSPGGCAHSRPLRRGLGDRLGPIRIVVQNARNDRLVHELLEAAGELEVVFDFRHDSWLGVDGVVAVNDFEAEPFRFIRLREPPHTEEELQALAVRLRPPAYVYFRHEDAPTAPRYAERLLTLLREREQPPG